MGRANNIASQHCYLSTAMDTSEKKTKKNCPLNK